MSQNTSVSDEVQLPITIKTSSVAVSFKAFFILAVFLTLFLYSVISFLKIWDTTCRAISHSQNYQSPAPTDQKPEVEEEESFQGAAGRPSRFGFEDLTGMVSLRAKTLIFFQSLKILQQRRSRWLLGVKYVNSLLIF